MNEAQVEAKRAAVAPLIAVVSASRVEERRRFDRESRQIVHRGCTGNAEREFADFRMRRELSWNYRNYPSGSSRGWNDNHEKDANL